MRQAGVVAGVLVATVACSGDGDSPDDAPVLRIDGPATVDDDGAGANQEGAPGGAEPIVPSRDEITDLG